MNTTTKKFLTPTEAAEYLRLRPSTVYKKVAANLLPSRKHFGKRVLTIEELDAWSEQQAQAREDAKPKAFKSRFEEARERLRLKRE